MSARRQPSTTSLSRYVRAHSPDFADRSLDFCNAFWGPNDAGVDVLFARMRGAIRTMEELRNFWKERAMIEEQYAKRLASLAKFPLGRDEIGDLRSSLETLRQETEKQASFHMNVAQQVKNDLEAPTNALINRQLYHKKNHQSAIEREFKMKQQQESHVNRAREKYENDCMRINSYTAQATIMQGKELEKIHAKLERAQQTVGANEQDFQKFTRILQETTARWEVDWKEFCDRCQDLEEERVEFMKDNMWAYANAVSTVCVADDESCERVRLALEQLEPEKDMEAFVYNYGTGNSIPDPPTFINYAKPDSIPASAQRPTAHPANFQRVTERTREFIPPQAPPPEEEPEPLQNTAGIGAGGGRSEPSAPQSRPASRASTRPAASQAPQPAKPGNGRTSVNYAPDPQADPISANEKTMLKVGDRAYPVDLSHNPQDRAGPGPNGSTAPVPGVGQDDDPLARQMQELRRAASNSSRQGPSPAPQQPQNIAQRPTHQPRDSASQLSPPPGGRGGGPPTKADYRKSAEFVVGGPPPDVSRSRPTTPIEPVMVKPPVSNQPLNGVSVQDVVADYHQSFPGERKSVSRPTSRAGSYSGQGPPQPQPQPPQGRPESMAGVGAQGRSPSPQPFRPPSRAASPMQQRPTPQPVQPAQTPAQARRNSSSMRGPVPGAVPTPMSQANGVGPGHQARQGSISVPMAGQPRAASPNPAGIVLDPSGRVSVDTLADRYNANRQHPPPAAPPQQAPGYRPPVQQNMGPQRSPSYPPPGQPAYNAPPPAGYGPPVGYGQPPPPPQNIPQHQPPPQPYGQQYPYGQAPAPQEYGRNNAPPAQQPYYGNGGPMQHPGYQPPPPPQAVQPYGRDPSPMRGPSPQPGGQQTTSPTGAYTDDGRPILFYVTALYDYQAVIDEEFDFQSGDVIAVTATPEDGWWSGELLDEARKQPGRHVFPSNFVGLL